MPLLPASFTSLTLFCARTQQDLGSACGGSPPQPRGASASGACRVGWGSRGMDGEEPRIRGGRIQSASRLVAMTGACLHVVGLRPGLGMGWGGVRRPGQERGCAGRTRMCLHQAAWARTRSPAGGPAPCWEAGPGRGARLLCLHSLPASQETGASSVTPEDRPQLCSP